MKGVTVVDHPLVQHKLTRLRDKDTSTKTFREIMREISTLLCYEATRDLALEDRAVETPFETTRSPQIAGVECPLPGSDTFQRTPFVSLHSTGGSACGATPVIAGPRHWGHW